jgi:hypothetical protein
MGVASRSTGIDDVVRTHHFHDREVKKGVGGAQGRRSAGRVSCTDAA